MEVVDPRGEPAWKHEGSDAWPLWVHLEGGVAPTGGGDVYFGPGVDALGGDTFAAARLVRGDPEAGLENPEFGIPAELSDLGVLPITTFAGFGAELRGAFRLLAGRGDRVRPVSAVVREIVYLVETRQLGHVLFDDADLGAYGDWLSCFESELAHLPWRVTWEGTIDGERRRG